MGLDALITPLEPTPIDVIMVDVFIIHECLKLVSKKNSVSERDNSVEGGNQGARNLLEFTKPGGKEFGAADGCRE